MLNLINNKINRNFIYILHYSIIGSNLKLKNLNDILNIYSDLKEKPEYIQVKLLDYIIQFNKSEEEDESIDLNEKSK